MAPRVFERGAVLVICWLACPTVSHAPNLARPSIWAGRAPRAIYLKAGASDGANAEVADATVVPPPLALRPIQRFLSTDLGRPTRVARFVGSLLLLWTWPWVLDAVRIRLTGGTAYANMFGAQLRLVRKMSFRLLVASACGSVMGLERKSADRPAGLRSMTLVSVGSCLYTLAVIYGTHGGDPGRAAAQVCTGVGFIGAGVIWKGSDIKSPVRGVTTACAVWVSAALGNRPLPRCCARSLPLPILPLGRNPPRAQAIRHFPPRVHRRRCRFGLMAFCAVRVRIERHCTARFALVQSHHWVEHHRNNGGEGSKCWRAWWR